MKDWQFWALMSSIWFTPPFGKDKGETAPVVISLLCILMLIYSLFPDEIHRHFHF